MTTSTHMSPIRSKRLARCDLRGRRRRFAELRVRAPRRNSVGHGRRTVGVAVGPHRPPASLFLPPTPRRAHNAPAMAYASETKKTLFGFFMVLETFLRSPRVHLFYNPTLAKWRSPSRMTRQTSISFKDSLEHPLEDAAWRLPHAARARQITNNKRIRSLARPP